MNIQHLCHVAVSLSSQVVRALHLCHVCVSEFTCRLCWINKFGTIWFTIAFVCANYHDIKIQTCMIFSEVLIIMYKLGQNPRLQKNAWTLTASLKTLFFLKKKLQH